ncbi:MAG: hypothetical protein ACD_46C00633G0002 [uncultured bacterium]|nr:MAG: hypothetical protein ACD_46C00633G0002 [uncultured bacterium]
MKARSNYNPIQNILDKLTRSENYNDTLSKAVALAQFIEHIKSLANNKLMTFLTVFNNDEGEQLKALLNNNKVDAVTKADALTAFTKNPKNANKLMYKVIEEAEKVTLASYAISDIVMKARK